MFLFSSELSCFVFIVDPSGAQKKVLDVATELGLTISVAVAHETGTSNFLWNLLSYLGDIVSIQNLKP